MMMSKGTTLLANWNFNDYIRESRGQSSDLKTWAKYNFFSPPSPPRAKKSGNNAGNGKYIVTVKNIYGAPPPSPEEHNEVMCVCRHPVKPLNTM